MKRIIILIVCFIACYSCIKQPETILIPDYRTEDFGIRITVPNHANFHYLVICEKDTFVINQGSYFRLPTIHMKDTNNIALQIIIENNKK